MMNGSSKIEIYFIIIKSEIIEKETMKIFFKAFGTIFMGD
jgi:hypothetical protein